MSYLLFFDLYECLDCMCIRRLADGDGGRKGIYSHPLELELHVVVSYHVSAGIRTQLP